MKLQKQSPVHSTAKQYRSIYSHLRSQKVDPLVNEKKKSGNETSTEKAF